MFNINEISSAISNIPDPEIPVISIKELGVLRSIEQQDDGLIITITPTYSGCPAMDRFQKDIKEQLDFLKVKKYKIKMQYDPAWTCLLYTSDAADED